MRQIDIDERRENILCAIVESYIETAQPIGSRAVSQHFRWTISPATIRNVMADLEEMGFITHPHTSSGRVPTDKGYRCYVNTLLETKRLTKEEENTILKMLRGANDFDSLMQAVSKAISVITNVAGIVLTPRLKKSVFKRIEFIPIDSSRVLTVILTRCGIVKSATLEIEDEIDKSELERLAEFLNQELDGIFLGEIKNYLTRKLLQQQDSFYTFLKKALHILSEPNLLKMDERIYFEGARCIMSQPEFSDVSKLKLFLEMFEDKHYLFDLLNEDMEGDGIKVHIGKENPYKHIQDCTLVTCNYKVDKIPIGALGAIGPTRMEYGKVISAVQYLSEVLGETLENRG